jgi:hypothetical protein
MSTQIRGLTTSTRSNTENFFVFSDHVKGVVVKNRSNSFLLLCREEKGALTARQAFQNVELVEKCG